MLRLIFFFDIIKVIKYKAALIAGTNFLDIILKSLQGCKLTLEDLVLTSCDTNLTSYRWNVPSST